MYCIDTSIYEDTRKFFAELEYWEVYELLKTFTNLDDRSDEFGGNDSGMRITAYSQNNTTSNIF